jgi:hypothetical protein
MRTLSPAPSSAIDPATREPRWGSYAGELPRVDLAALERGALWTLARRKRWMYVCVAHERLWIAAAIVDLGYAGNAFVLAYDAALGRVVADASAIGLPGRFDVNDCAGEGHRATFRSRRLRASFARAPGSSTYAIEIEAPAASLEARMDASSAPPPIAAVARIEGGVVNVTQKRALLDVRGSVRLGARRHDLTGGLGGYDHTSGLLARHTAWKWAFAMGRAKSGERVAWNLVEGFVGEPECALWIDGALHPLAEGRFAHDVQQPLAEWRLTTRDDSVDLKFAPGGLHADRTNLGLVRSRFVQPIGAYSGTIRAPGRAIALDGVLGVTEDQDVVW